MMKFALIALFGAVAHSIKIQEDEHPQGPPPKPEGDDRQCPHGDEFTDKLHSLMNDLDHNGDASIDLSELYGLIDHLHGYGWINEEEGKRAKKERAEEWGNQTVYEHDDLVEEIVKHTPCGEMFEAAMWLDAMDDVLRCVDEGAEVCKTPEWWEKELNEVDEEHGEEPPQRDGDGEQKPSKPDGDGEQKPTKPEGDSQKKPRQTEGDAKKQKPASA